MQQHESKRGNKKKCDVLFCTVNAKICIHSMLLQNHKGPTYIVSSAESRVPVTIKYLQEGRSIIAS